MDSLNEDDIFGDNEESTALVPTEVVDGGAIAAISRAEVDGQIATAKQYPRSIKEFMRNARDLVCLSRSVAGSCIYSLPRSGKQITGPSIRFAEMIASAYGNIHAAARITEDGAEFLTAQSVVWDLERNLRLGVEVRQRITDKHGKRYNEDMRGVAGNAAISKAYRNGVLRVIPKALWEPIFEEAKKASFGKMKTVEERRFAMLEAFKPYGVSEALILSHLEKPGMADVGDDELIYLRGILTAIKEEGESVNSIFSKSSPTSSSRVGKSDLAPKTKPAEKPPVAETTPEEPPVESVQEADDVPFEPSEPAVPIAAEPANKLADAETLDAVRSVKAEVKAALRAKKVTARQAADLNESIQLREAALTAE